MLSALLSLVVSMGVLGVLAGVVSGVIFLVDAALMWGNAVRTSVETASRSCPEPESEPLLTTRVNGTVIAVDRPITPVPRLEAKRLAGPWAAGVRARDEDGDAEVSAQDLEHMVPDLGADLEPVLDAELEPGLEPGQGPVAGVRQLMERLVETLVSGGLDDVALRPKHPHPEYHRVYKRHQPRLRSALTSLAYSLQMALSRKPLSECETPGRAHAQLRAIILDLARDVAALEQCRPALGYSGDPLEGSNDFASKAYEDILATAIVNKVMERSSSRNSKKHFNNNFVGSLEVRMGSVDDSPESVSSWTESWTSSGRLELENSPDTSLDNRQDPEDSEHGTDPLSLMIEECIEEVTTITASSSPSTTPSSSADEYSDEGSRWDRVRERRARRQRRRRSSVRDPTAPTSASSSGPPSILAGLSFVNKRVPFPELGVDIVDADWPQESDGSLSGSESQGGSAESDADDATWPTRTGGDGRQEDSGSTTASRSPRSSSRSPRPRPASCLELVTPLQSWEDNWLFQSRRQRKPDAQYSHHPVPVPMLVPNPSEDFRALIGDVDAEETSDLSECSDDVLEELILSGSAQSAESSELASRPHPDLHPELRPEQQPDPRTLNVSALEGLAETCNLELLKRAARNTVTKAHQLSPHFRGNPQASVPPAQMEPRPSVHEDSERSEITDKDADFTVVYDTPSRKEIPISSRNGESTTSHHKTVPVSNSSPSSKQPLTIVQSTATKDHSLNGFKEFPQENVNGHKDEIFPPERVVETEQINDTKENSVKDQNIRKESRQSDLPEKSKPELKQEDPSDPLQDRLIEDNRPSDVPLDLATPPRPGTIAEREHRKWLEARPLPNNPYSPENIERRLRQRASIAGATLPVTPVVNTSPSQPLGSALQIALSVDPDPKKYGRDFYINPRRPSDVPSVPLNSMRKLSTTVAENGHEVDWKPAPADVRTNGDGGSEESPRTEELEHEASVEQLGAPSVKELAKQFLNQPQPEEQIVNNRQSAVKSPQQAQARVVIVPKDAAADVDRERRPVRQVHSLTARSMSKEFREGLRNLSVSPVTRTTRAQPPQRPDPEGARQPTDSES